jgi:hypothetical protein
MKKIIEFLVYLLSLYTLFVFTREVLITEFGVKITRPIYVFDEIFLFVGGFVLGIVLYIFKGRVNKIFATVMIIENVVVLFILLKYWI